MRSKTEVKVLNFIREKGLLEKGEPVIAGVSGGADSMCMLLMLDSLKEEYDLKIVAAHVNHGIRGAEADADAEFVKSFCKEHDITFELISTDIPELAKQTGTTCEEAGRNFRYDYFLKLAEKYGAEKIAVAHNSGDNAETVLFNIFRGSGISGLKGILPVRIPAEGNGIKIIRPVLCLTRHEIEEYLKEKRIGFRIDSTNKDENYSRNRIRNTILPLVKEHINCNAEGHIASLGRQAAEIEDLIRTLTDEGMANVRCISVKDGKITKCIIDYPGISGMHPVIRKSIIRRAFEFVAGRLKDVEEIHILAIDELFRKQSGKKLSMPYGITVTKEYDNIVLEKEQDENSEICDPEDIVSLKVADRESLMEEIPKDTDEKWFDFEKIGFMPVLRTMEEGDYLLIGPEKHRKSLKRFMIDNKIPLDERGKLLLLAAGSHILWVVGYRRDDSCLVTGDTKKVLIAKKNK